MKKLIALLLLSVMLIGVFCGCGDDDSNLSSNGSGNSQQTIVSDEKVNSENSEGSSSINSTQNKQPIPEKAYVVRSFLAVRGAVIYDLSYDDYGYPDCCYFHKKCDFCGDVSNNNGSARSNLITSYYCPKCKTSNPVEIKADADWVEVYK